MIRKVQYILLGAFVLLGMACSTANTVAPAQNVAVSAEEGEAASFGTTLTTIRSEVAPEPKLVLETSEPPAYTSYRPQPDVFVVDLPRVVKAPDLAIPTELPEFIASVSAEEVIELGAPLTRVSLRFAEPVKSEIGARDGRVEISFDRGSPAVAENEEPPVTEEIPEVETAVVAEDLNDADAPETIVDAEPAPVTVESIEPAAETADVATRVAGPAEPVPTHPASELKSVEYQGVGSALSVLLETDGRNEYESFTLDNPLRLVVDLKGVVNQVDETAFELSDPFVQRIRVAQFASDPDPVARVVMDLAELPEYTIDHHSRGLSIRFGSDLAQIEPAPEPPAATPVKQASLEPDIAPDFDPYQAEHVVHAPQQTTDETETGVIQTTIDAEPVENVPGMAEDPVRTVGPEIGGGTMRQPGESVTVTGGASVYTGEPIDLSLTNADIIDVLRLFSELTGLNIAIDPGVSGTVTVDFTGVPWDQALELILRQNNLDYVLEGNVMRIGTVDRLAQEQAQRRELEEQQELNQPLSTVIKYLSYAKAGEISGILQQMLSQRGQIVVDQRTNQLIITDIESNIETVFNLIETLDIPTPQVVIEARIVETTKTFARQLGITWGFTGTLDPALGTGTGLTFPNTVDVIGGPFDLSVGNPVLDLSLGNVLGTFSLDVLLTAAESEGLVKVVSAPKVTTQDNEQAEIQSGVQIPVQTRVNFTTTVQYIDATLRLNVTPQVTAEGTVIMEIEVQKVEPALGLTVVGGQNSPLITRRATTKLMVRDGGTTVIGGIYQATDNDSQTRVPFLHQIPILGNLFKNSDVNKRHDELLIFITPRIVRNP
ncbi:MAG: type IV pilus secretin PilQ [Thermoanaerobaculia bacterium]|nr:type IV pilus secretin PilQ [Thermoanaerobaculia bacterium]